MVSPRLRLNSVRRQDPSQTTALRQAYMNEMAKRFSDFRNAVYALLVKEDALGLMQRKPNPLRTNTRWEFATNPDKVNAFNRWMKQQVKQGVLGVVGDDDPERPWSAKYIESAYKKGANRAYKEEHSKALAKSSDFYEGRKSKFLDDTFSSKQSVDSVRMLFMRDFSQLKDVTSTMEAQMSRILADGLANGKGPREIAKEMDRSIAKLTKARALTIARTEIVRAQAEGQLDSFEQAGQLEVAVDAEWDTADDGKVCKMCRPLDGVIMPIKKARGLLPRHPNCRCAWMPSIDDPLFREPGQKRTPGAVGKALGKSIMAEKPGARTIKAARRASSWAGAAPRMQRGLRKRLYKALKRSISKAQRAKPVADLATVTAKEVVESLATNGIKANGAITFGAREAAMEAERMATQFPGVANLMRNGKSIKVTFHTKSVLDKRGHLGFYDGKTGNIEVGLGVGKATAAPRLGAKAFSVGDDAGTIFRHEYGHRYFYHGVDRKMQDQWIDRIAPGLANDPVAAVLDPGYKDVTKNAISRYSTSNFDELFAESFAAYTHKGYKRGSLPKKIEAYFDRVLKKPKLTGKAAAVRKTTKQHAFFGHAPGTSAEKINELLYGRAMTLKEVAAETGLKPSRISAHVQAMIKKGRIQKVGDGTYKFIDVSDLPPPGTVIPPVTVPPPRIPKAPKPTPAPPKYDGRGIPPKEFRPTPPSTVPIDPTVTPLAPQVGKGAAMYEEKVQAAYIKATTGYNAHVSPSATTKAVKNPAKALNAISNEIEEMYRHPQLAAAMKKSAENVVVSPTLSLNVEDLDQGLMGSYQSSFGYNYQRLNVRASLRTKDVNARYGEWTISDTLPGVFRHEYGHHHWYSMLDSTQRAEFKDIAVKYVKTDEQRHRVHAVIKDKKNFPISMYASVNDREVYAESFAAFTHKKYKPGDLPKDIEAYFIKHVGLRQEVDVVAKAVD